MKEKICIVVIIIIVGSIALISYYWSYPGTGEYRYQEVRTTITFKNVTIEKEEVFNFLSTNPNITIQQIMLEDVKDKPFERIRFRHVKWNRTHDNHNFLIWMDSNILNSDFNIKFVLYSRDNIRGEKREEVDKESEDLFIKDKQISENITKDMVNEFILFINKEPEPFEFKKIVLKPPSM